MNLILFEPDEVGRPLVSSDPRAQHLVNVLRRQPGDTFDAGIVGSTRGTGVVRGLDENGLQFDFKAHSPLPPRRQLRLLIGWPRPQTARDILRDATTLGATTLEFVHTARSDRNYASSPLWTSGEWRRHMLTGAAQAFDPRIPAVRWNRSLKQAVEPFGPGDEARWALDLYEATAPLAELATHSTGPVSLAFGPERGWDQQDREILRRAGFTLASLNLPVLRVETAVVVALALVSALGPRPS